MSEPEQISLEYKQEFDLHQLEASLSLAEIRCCEWVEIRDRLRSIWKDPQADEIILRVHEMDLSDDERHELAIEVTHLSVIAERFRGPDRYKLDRRITRLARALPQDIINEYAYRELEHPRKLRRIGAYKILRNIGINAQLAPRLVALFQRNQEEELLHLIARSPDAIEVLDVTWLVSVLHEQYWRMRVIEGLLRKNDDRVMQFLNTHPREFVHAIGRAEAAHLGEVIIKLIDTQQADLELLSLIAWALGRIKNRDGLAKLREKVQRIIPTSDNLHT